MQIFLPLTNLFHPAFEMISLEENNEDALIDLVTSAWVFKWGLNLHLLKEHITTTGTPQKSLKWMHSFTSNHSCHKSMRGIYYIEKTVIKGEVHSKIGTFFSFQQPKTCSMIGHLPKCQNGAVQKNAWPKNTSRKKETTSRNNKPAFKSSCRLPAKLYAELFDVIHTLPGCSVIPRWRHCFSIFTLTLGKDFMEFTSALKAEIGEWQIIILSWRRWKEKMSILEWTSPLVITEISISEWKMKN